MTALYYELAKSTSSDIILSRDCILDFSIEFKYEGSARQSFTGWALDTPYWRDGDIECLDSKTAYKHNMNLDNFRRMGSAFGAEVIKRIMDVFSVTKFKDIPGKYVYVLKEEGFNGLIKGIQQLPVDGDKKLIMDDLYEELKDTVFDPHYALRLKGD